MAKGILAPELSRTAAGFAGRLIAEIQRMEAEHPEEPWDAQILKGADATRFLQLQQQGPIGRPLPLAQQLFQSPPEATIRAPR